MGSPEPASPAVVVGALETLQCAPMRAPLTLTPGARASTELVGWHEATRITEGVALGCIAASCSGACSAFHRGAAPQDQEAFAEVAVAFLSAPAWQSDPPLVDLSRITVDAGAAHVHERRVCCLIPLGRGRGACGTGPDLDPAERRRRITDHANRAPRGTDLHLGVDHVP